MVAGSTIPAAEQVQILARAVARLSPCWRNPEQFHLAKSEIVSALRRLARVLVLPPSRVPAALPPFKPVQPRMAALALRTQPPARIVAAAPPVVVPVLKVASQHRAAVRRRHRYPKPPRLALATQPQLF